MNKHISLYTLSDFEGADHETRKEILEFWQYYGQPSSMPFWADRLITAIETGRYGGGILSFAGGEHLKEFAKAMLNEIAPV